MAVLTGVPVSNALIASRFERVKQSMPVQPKLIGFISSQQMGVTQLAIEYCSVLIEDTSARASYWPDFPWGTSKATAFNDRSAVVDPMMANIIGLGLPTQPDSTTVAAQVNGLIDGLLPGTGDTDSIMKGACAAVLGSAAMLVQ